MARGAYGLLVFFMRLIISEADLIVSSLRNPNYTGSVNYVCTIFKNGKIIKELLSCLKSTMMSNSAPPSSVPWGN